MEKRVVVFLILSLAIIIGYDYVLKQAGLIPPPAESDQLPAPGSSAPTQESSAPAADQKGPTETARDLTTTSKSASQLPPAEPASGEQTQEIVTELFRAVFSNRGAVLTSWELTR